MKKLLFFFVFFLAITHAIGTQAQGFLGRLKQKAEQIGERVIDKTVDDLLSGKKAEPKEPPLPQEEVVKLPGYEMKEMKKVPPPVSTMILTDTIISDLDTVYHFNTASVNPQEFVSYALTLKGTPYSFGSVDPAFGLDCSGFITHVFNHFNISVPRRTFDFKNAEKKVSAKDAKPGDLILFTGTNEQSRVPGHMGIVTSNKGKVLEFIHAASGRTNAVTTSLLSNSYFKPRFLEVVRVF